MEQSKASASFGQVSGKVGRGDQRQINTLQLLCSYVLLTIPGFLLLGFMGGAWERTVCKAHLSQEPALCFLMPLLLIHLAAQRALLLRVLAQAPRSWFWSAQEASTLGILSSASLLIGTVPLLLYQPPVAWQELCQHLL